MRNDEAMIRCRQDIDLERRAALPADDQVGALEGGLFQARTELVPFQSDRPVWALDRCRRSVGRRGQRGSVSHAGGLTRAPSTSDSLSVAKTSDVSGEKSILTRSPPA